MSPVRTFRYSLALSAVALGAAVASAAPPVHSAARPGGPPPGGGPRLPAQIGGGYRGPVYAPPPVTRVYGGIGYGYNPPFGYGYGPGFFPTFGSPYSTFGPNYGVGGSYSTLGLRIGGPTYVPPVIGTTVVPSFGPSLGPPIPNVPLLDPVPLPLPAAGETAPATIVVLTKEGATVSFDGVDSPPGGARHSFTTKPLPTGTDTRVSVNLNGGAITVTLRVRGGESATVDLR